MKQEIRLWEIGSNNALRECSPAALDLESRLEGWLERDISLVAPDLQVIGRQVATDFGTCVDLLCINEDGDLTIVELKRGKTPREVTAQALDYASWVQDLPSERIISIANDYLGHGKSLEEVFEHRFSKALPEGLNEGHQILIVGSEIDESTERIVKYLSDTHGVSINVARFRYFKAADGQELVARVFLIEPSQVEYRTRTKGSSKRRPNLTYEQLEELAEKNGVGELYREFVSGLEDHFQRHTTRSSIVFTSNLDSSHKAVLSLIPGESSGEEGLRFQIYLSRFRRAFGLSETEVETVLPTNKQSWIYSEKAGEDWAGFAGFFRNMDDVRVFLNGLSNKAERNR